MSADELDRVIHEPARLRIMMVLSGADMADFNFLVSALGMTKGNLSAHTDRLEKAGYVKIEKGFNGKIPYTTYRITKEGSEALQEYWRSLDKIRKSAAR